MIQLKKVVSVKGAQTPKVRRGKAKVYIKPSWNAYATRKAVDVSLPAPELIVVERPQGENFSESYKFNQVIQVQTETQVKPMGKSCAIWELPHHYSRLGESTILTEQLKTEVIVEGLKTKDINYILTQALRMSGLQWVRLFNEKKQRKFRVNVKFTPDNMSEEERAVFNIMFPHGFTIRDLVIQKLIPIYKVVNDGMTSNGRELLKAKVYKVLKPTHSLTESRMKRQELRHPALLAVANSAPSQVLLGYNVYFTKECVNHYKGVLNPSPFSNVLEG